MNWSEHLTNSVIDRIIQLRITDIESSILQLIRQAQDELVPKTIQRSFVSKVVAAPIIEAVKARMKPEALPEATLESRLTALEDYVLELEARLQKQISAYPITTVTKITKAPKPKITIIGLKPNQINDIEAACGHRCEIKHLDAKSPKLDPGSADLVILSRFAGHMWSDKYPNLVRIPGGVTSIRAYIHKFLDARN